MFELVPCRRNRGALAGPRKDLLDWFFEDLSVPDFWTAEREWVPAFDVSETENEVIVKGELPGMDVKDIDIALTDGLLTIKGERRLEKEDKKENYHRIERQFGSFSRSLNLGTKVRSDGIEATYKDGILSVNLPKVEASNPKRIEVKS